MARGTGAYERRVNQMRAERMEQRITDGEEEAQLIEVYDMPVSNLHWLTLPEKQAIEKSDIGFRYVGDIVGCMPDVLTEEVGHTLAQKIIQGLARDYNCTVGEPTIEDWQPPHVRKRTGLK